MFKSYQQNTLQHTLTFTESKFTPTQTWTKSTNTNHTGCIFFFNYILHFTASNAFSLQTMELINNCLPLLDSPWGEKHTTAPYYDSLIPATSTDVCTGKYMQARTKYTNIPQTIAAIIKNSGSNSTHFIFVSFSFMVAIAPQCVHHSIVRFFLKGLCTW